MKKNGTSLFANGLIWFGAGVSLAEILTGTAYASMPLSTGLLSIVLGHIIGGVLMFMAGLIGGRTGKSAMETTKLSFGGKGALLFCWLNIAQLAGWTAIMIYDGGVAADGILSVGRFVWCALIGVLIAVWLLIGVKSLSRVNTVAMAGLFALTLVLCKVIFFDGNGAFGASADAMSFGGALELAVAMPLSWLPLISDYTREAEEPVKATAVSVVVYSLVSSWMYLIGMGAAALAGSSDIAQIMLTAGLGVAGLIIVVLSTVTTTFLDAYSAGVSGEAVSPKLTAKNVGLVVTVVGTVCAILFPMDDITDFLYLIGSVFAPMIAVQIADHFILGVDRSDEPFAWESLIVWLAGFLLYRMFMGVDLPVGSTVPAMLLTMALRVALGKIIGTEKKR